MKPSFLDVQKGSKHHAKMKLAVKTTMKRIMNVIWRSLLQTLVVNQIFPTRPHTIRHNLVRRNNNLQLYLLELVLILLGFHHRLKELLLPQNRVWRT